MSAGLRMVGALKERRVLAKKGAEKRVRAKQASTYRRMRAELGASGARKSLGGK